MRPLQAETLRRALEHRKQALDFYGESRLSATIADLRRARELASAARSTALEDESRFWHGAALHGAGRLREALAAWGPALSREDDGPLSRSRYMALTRLLLVIIDIPLPLEIIEKTISETARRLGVADGSARGRRSRVLLARARLALARGRWSEAFDFAREALETHRRERAVYSYSTYCGAVVRCALELGELELVEHYLRDWEANEHRYLHVKRLRITAARANLARVRGHHGLALATAAPLEAQCRDCEEVVYAQEARVAFVRACLAAGEPHRCRTTLARALRSRDTCIGDQRFEALLLLGDYHLVVAESSPGDERHLHRLRARRALDLALAEALRLDGNLRSDHRRESVAERLVRLRGLGEG